MYSKRNIFVFSLIFISFIFWRAWKREQIYELNQKFKLNNYNYINHKINKDYKNNIITVMTDVLLLKINTQGGNIEDAFLLKYKDKLNSVKPFHFLKTLPNYIYQAQSGIITKDQNNNYINNFFPLFNSKKKIYFLKKNQNKIYVPLTYIDNNGIIYTKTYILNKNSYSFNVNYNINNTSNKPIYIILFAQLKQTINFINYKYNSSVNNYHDTAYYTDNEHYKKYTFIEILDKNLNISTFGGWIAMVQKYFTSAWIPRIPGKNIFYTKKIHYNQAIIGFKSNLINLPPGQNKNLISTLWIGPKIQNKMYYVDKNLDLTINYGYLWFIYKPLFILLNIIHKYVKNWGLSIIFITIIVRILMYPLIKAQQISLNKMNILKPKLIELRKKFSNNSHRLSFETIKLYKKEKINPITSCLPLLIQIPVFFTLYYMLSNSIELRHAPLFFWIHDLSDKDPYYVLPILLGSSMFFFQKNSQIYKKNNNYLNKFLPLIFSIFFLYFPSGLVLYYIISNWIAIIQQKLILRSLKKKK